VPRPANPETRRRLLGAGLDLIYSRGYASVGVKDVTDTARIPKGSFYNYFVTKEQFVSEVAKEYWAGIEAAYGPILDGPQPDALSRVAAYFRALADDHARRGYTPGCLIGNLSLELAATSEQARETLRQLLTRWEDALACCLRQARQDGQLSAGCDVTDLASLLIEAWEGAVMRAKLDRSQAAYRRFDEVTLPRLLAG
jgi:TetR/AcrR family transcriptional repressor of nem operon